MARTKIKMKKKITGADFGSYMVARSRGANFRILGEQSKKKKSKSKQLKRGAHMWVRCASTEDAAL